MSELIHSVPSLVLDPSHVYHDLIARKSRYKVYWGGRGAAKSWAVAEALIRISVKKCVRVLCCREIQNTIRDSSHKLLKDTIERLNLSSFFEVTKDSIRSRTGSEFIFKGLFNNENGLKSIEGIDICWVEEAHAVSDPSWRSLIPSIRAAASEIWITFNMMDESDPAYQRFVENRRTDSIVHKVNYDANPYFWSSPLAQEMEDDKKLDYTMYEHIWEGMPLKIDDSIIFSGKYEIQRVPTNMWEKADRLFFGADFGFAQDPSVLIREFVVANTLYIDHEAYGTGVELDEMGDFYAAVPGSKEWPIKADGSRPETISHIRGKFGYNISAAEKWDGSVKDGIAHLRHYDKIIIDPRCKGIAAEARQYRYKVDRVTKEVLPVIVDKHNHGWDASRYGLDGHIQRGGNLGIWARLGQH